MTDSSVTLVHPIQQTLTGAKVYPCLPCFLDGPINTSRPSSQYLQAAVRLVMSPVDGQLRIPDIAPAATYLGEELYTKETNWREALPVSIDPRSVTVDNTLGPISSSPQATFPAIVRGFLWMAKNREEAHDLLGFFGRRQGRFKPLWVPSGVDDIFLDAPALSTDVGLLTRPFDYSSLVSLHPARRHVLFLMRDGSRLARRIESVEAVGSQSLLTIDQPLGVPATPANVKRISYLGLYRLGSDDISFPWHTDSVVEVESNLVLREPKT
jgi:hypothetical protein